MDYNHRYKLIAKNLPWYTFKYVEDQEDNMLINTANGHINNATFTKAQARNLWVSLVKDYGYHRGY